MYPSPSVSNSKASHVPLLSASTGNSLASNGLVPQSSSNVSFQLSSSSSVSSTNPVDEVPVIVSGIPSSSVSFDAEGSCGKSSALFPTSSPSISSSQRSHSLSPSRSSGTSDASLGSVPHASSLPSGQPSKSWSSSFTSQMPLLLASIGTEKTSFGSVLHIISSVSMNESPSSSSSI